jgi:hypothetical protein
MTHIRQILDIPYNKEMIHVPTVCDTVTPGKEAAEAVDNNSAGVARSRESTGLVIVWQDRSLLRRLVAIVIEVLPDEGHA